MASTISQADATTVAASATIAIRPDVDPGGRAACATPQAARDMAGCWTVAHAGGWDHAAVGGPGGGHPGGGPGDGIQAPALAADDGW